MKCEKTCAAPGIPDHVPARMEQSRSWFSAPNGRRAPEGSWPQREYPVCLCARRARNLSATCVGERPRLKWRSGVSTPQVDPNSGARTIPKEERERDAECTFPHFLGPEDVCRVSE